MAKSRQSKKLITEEITNEEAEGIFAEYATADAKIQKITAEMDGKIIKIRESYDTQLTDLKTAKDGAFEKLQHFAQANPDQFTKKKSLEMTQGVIGFRTTPESVGKVKGFTWDAVTNMLKEFLPDYVRTKEEPNKESILKDKEQIQHLFPKVGIKIEQSETFYVEPKKETA